MGIFCSSPLLRIVAGDFSTCLNHGLGGVLQIANTFRKKNIPCDVVWMDIDYMDKFKCFTFDMV